jgi:hypothetical protein
MEINEVFNQARRYAHNRKCFPVKKHSFKIIVSLMSQDWNCVGYCLEYADISNVLHATSRKSLLHYCDPRPFWHKCFPRMIFGHSCTNVANRHRGVQARLPRQWPVGQAPGAKFAGAQAPKKQSSWKRALAVKSQGLYHSGLE